MNERDRVRFIIMGRGYDVVVPRGNGQLLLGHITKNDGGFVTWEQNAEYNLYLDEMQAIVKFMEWMDKQ